MVGQTADPLHETQQVRFHHHILTLISILLCPFFILFELSLAQIHDNLAAYMPCFRLGKVIQAANLTQGSFSR